MKKTADSNIVNWKLEDAVASDCQVSSDKANKVIKLLNDGSTIPFIARYRKECTGNLNPTILHKIKDKMEECIHVIEHVEKSMKSIEKSGLLSDNVKVALQSCKTMEDVEFVTEPFKSKGPRTLAGRARQAGLEPLAMKILFDQIPFVIENFVPQSAIDEFGDLEHIEEALRNIIADVFAKDITLLDGAEKLNCPSSTVLTSSLKRKWVKADPKVKIDEQMRKMVEKLRTYHSFQKPLQRLLSHQIMAINRGEKNKVLDVAIQFPDSLQHVFIDLCNKRYLVNMCPHLRPFVTDCALDAYKRLVRPHLTRKIRGNLTKNAQNESLSVFESNLRHLVMMSPLRAVPLLGIDPGHFHGTKLAVIDRNSRLLDTAVIHLSKGPQQLEQASAAFCRLVHKHGIEHIAIGDGCGNELASKLVSHLITCGAFLPLQVRFAIVRECGASVWSVTPESCTEFPNLDPNLRSAVSIARRLQDPLAEYVKMDPKSLGVGMYQHDLADRSLVAKVNVVLDECISFTGVDLNCAPPHVLAHVSGLGASRAAAIVEHRQRCGDFRNRRQLLSVAGIGKAVFVQCAGFVRVKNVEPPSALRAAPRNFDYEPDGAAMMMDVSEQPRRPARGRKPKTDDSNTVNPLDQTAIHPESYEVAERIIELLNLEPSDIGTTAMQQATKNFTSNHEYKAILSNFMTESCGLETLEDIVLCLSRPLEFDERNNFGSSMLRESYGNSSDLSLQQPVTGFVTNVTTFGMFIDIGVERSAFCPRVLEGAVLGDTVQGVVSFIDANKLSLDRLRKVPRF